jgi:RNase P subunit RPR2
MFTVVRYGVVMSCSRCGVADAHKKRGVCLPCHAALSREYRARVKDGQIAQVLVNCASCEDLAAIRVKCNRCGEAKPLTEFYANRSRLPWGVHSLCRSCFRETQAVSKARDPERVRAVKLRSHLKRTYGLSVEAYEAMLVEQGGVCAICSRRPGDATHGRLVVDHRHSTGEIRGLLCEACNSVLGLFGDSPVRLEVAADYLERHRAGA